MAVTGGGMLITSMSTATMVLVITMAWSSVPWLVWNGSESTSIGLYRVHTIGKLMVNDFVMAIPPRLLTTAKGNC